MPESAMLKAKAAYGKSIEKSLADAAERMSDQAYLSLCFEKMSMDKGLMDPAMESCRSMRATGNI